MPGKKNACTILLLLTHVFFIINCYSQKNPTKLLGAVEIDNFSSIDQTEVTVQEYVYFIINNNFDLSLFPKSKSISPSARLFFDDLRKQKDFIFIELETHDPIKQVNYGVKGFKVTKKYNRFVALDTAQFSIALPIVGISFEQANRFCKWREGLVNLKKVTKVSISLPPVEVYKNLIENIDSVRYTKLRRDSCLRYQFNFRHKECVTSKKHAHLKQQGKGLVRVDTYSPSRLKLYCVQGNAAEMTSIKGIAVGGSFHHFANESSNKQVQPYEKEEGWLGFRCLITLK
jgi:hypothetical protein